MAKNIAIAGLNGISGKFDGSGRVVIEGIYTDNTYTSQSAMQGFVDGLSCYNSTSTTYYEERTTGTSSLYTNNCFPTGGTDERIYNYYDDYDLDADGTPDYSYWAQSLTGEQSPTTQLLGLPTIVMKKILGTSDWLISVLYYDKKYNTIQVQSGNQYYPTGVGKTTITTVIDFEGRLTERKEQHVIGRDPIGFGDIDVIIRNTYSYDKANRLTRVKQGHNGGTMIIVADYEYNPLGQLVDKKLHSTNNGSSYLQSVDFRYNIRGQLTSINNSKLDSDAGVTNDETNDVWGMNLFYEQQENASGQIGNTANWTGMLSAVKWKASISGGNTDERSYIFAYDKLYRLINAEYKAFDPTPRDWSKQIKGYDEIASYDWNGNILSMERWAVLSGTRTKIDEMTYSYASDKNRLEDVTEASSNSYGFINFTSSSSSYTYDANGNLTGDPKKGTTITYNELNKPVTITENASPYRYIEYTYDAAGIRLSKTTYNGSTTTTLNYVAGTGVVADANTTPAFKYFAMAEGKVRVSGSTFTYEYFITDYQGNVRVSFEDNGSGTAVARQENSYYPFGMMMPGNYTPSDPNKRLYNAGSEWQDDFGGIIDYYSTFFREYDATIGRFNSVDPKAEVTVSLSIYHYSGNNPVNFNDPLGDISGSELDMIIDKLWNSDYGGSWSSNSNIIGYFGDENTAEFFGRAGLNGINPMARILEVIAKLTGEGKEIMGFSLRDNNNNWSVTVGYAIPGNSYSLPAVFQEKLYFGSMIITCNEYRDLSDVAVGGYKINLGKYSENSSFFDGLEKFMHYAHEAGLALEAGKYLNYAKFNTPLIGEWGWWQDSRGGFQRIGWTGNGSTGGRTVAKSFASNLEKISRPILKASALFSLGTTIIDIRNGNWNGAVLHGADAVMGGIALTGWGAPLAFGYFVGRLLGEIF